MRTGRHRALNVLAMVSAVREQHWELAAPVTPHRLWRVLAAEAIDVLHGRIRRPARARGFDGAFAITIRHDLSLRDAWKWALHEYAHIKLGHFADADHGEEPIRELAPCRRDDPRELEAKLFARCLALGPTATPETPAIAELFDELTSHHYRVLAPAQLPLEIPETAPRPAFVAKSRREFTADEARAHERRLAAAGARKMRRVSNRTTDDDERIRFLDERVGTARFTDGEGRLWWIYNFRAVVDGAGKRRREIVRDFMSREIKYRVFVNAIGVRRVYRFADRRELRAYNVKHLDRQIAEATAWKRSERGVPRRESGVRG